MGDEKSGTRGVDWRAADMRNVNLSCINLEGADLRAADLSGANFTGSNLRYADLRGANVSGANFQNANLYGAKLQGIEAFQTDFRGADLRQSNLGGAYLDGAMLPPLSMDKGPLPSPSEVAAYRGEIGRDAGPADKSQEPWDERIKRSRRNGDQGGEGSSDANERYRVRSLPAEQRDKPDKSRGR